MAAAEIQQPAGRLHACQPLRVHEVLGLRCRRQQQQHEVGLRQPFFLIAGPCVIEGPTLTQEIAGRLFLSVPVNSPAPDHIYLFRTPEEAIDMVREAGFDIQHTLFSPCTGVSLARARKHRLTISVTGNLESSK